MSITSAAPKVYNQWTEDKIETALRELMGENLKWPMVRQFQATKQGRSLYSSMSRNNSIRYWKHRLCGEASCLESSVRGRKKIWTEEKIESELRKLAGNPPVWPTTDQFSTIPSLYAVISGGKGVKEWQRRLGVTKRSWRISDEAIEAAIWEVVGESQYWPKIEDFVKAGQITLYTNTIRRYGGAKYWRKKMGLQLAPRNKKQNYTRWTDQEILAQLEDFTGMFVEWPTSEEFIKYDKELLYQAIRRHGGIEYWAEQVGFVKPTDRAGRPSTPHQTYVLRLQDLMEEYGDTNHLPPSQWIQEKDSGLFAYIGRTGGLDKWNADMGFLPRPRGTNVKKWTGKRLRREIKTFLDNLDQNETQGFFPTKRFFKTDKQRNLHTALSKYGGIRFWAHEFNLELSPRSWKARPVSACRELLN